MTDWDFLTTELATLDHAGLLACPRTVESAQGAWMTVDGKRVLNLCSNNYRCCPSIACMQGLRSAVGRLLIKLVAKVRRHAIA
jgi:hypothetical protein